MKPLLLLVACSVAMLASPTARSQSNPARPSASAVRPYEPPLAGANSVSNVEVKKNEEGRWIVSFEYFFTGEPQDTWVRVSQLAAGSRSVNGEDGTTSVSYDRANRGTHRRTVVLQHPSDGTAVTSKIHVGMGVGMMATSSPIKVTKDVNIVWPHPVVTEVEAAIKAGQPQKIVDKAVELIDKGNRPTLEAARFMLQALIERQPTVDSAYVELARVAMKTNWSAAGLRDAESLIRSALKLKPDSVNAKILLGYVLAHQDRYKEAEALFVQSAVSDPPNLYLWANWGELFYRQKRWDESLAKYREAIKRPPTRNTYDRARKEAYETVLYLLRRKGDVDGLEATLKQRVRDYPNTSCFDVEYARFLASQRLDDSGALAHLRDFPSPSCDEADVRNVQGLAHYVRWSRATPEAKTPSLLQARAFMPPGPMVFYMLASSDPTVTVAQQLISAGDKIAIQDRDRFDALGMALRDGDIGTARRLLRLGAKPTALQGTEQIPAAVIPVMDRNEEGIRLMQRSGVDYSRLRYGNGLLFDAIRASGDKKLLEMLQPKAGGV